MSHKKLQQMVILALLVLVGSCSYSGDDSPMQQTFDRLDAIRDREKETINEHFTALAQAAESISFDEVMVESFQRLLPSADLSPEMENLTREESQSLDSHFVHRYGIFYDLLFVDSSGFIFHSIKMESDHHTNLLTGELADTRLAVELKANPLLRFVDFEPYGPSGEPAAFFVAPVQTKGEVKGWFILQYGSNELNAMLTNREDLGRTGEVYLVNAQRQMLSDSRFINASTILQVAADTEPVRLAFASEPGHTVSLDYRGVSVFSSYTTISFPGVTWAIIVEIDADEIVSEYYRNNQGELLAAIVSYAKANPGEVVAAGSAQVAIQADTRVDVNESRRVSDGEICWTPGVGPCTALVAYQPRKFGYLVHLGPTDDVYVDDPLTKMFLGTKRTDLVGNLLDRLARFDIVDNDLGLIQFIIVATHTNSMEGILEMLLDKGIGLSQIKIAYDASADFANVSYSQATDEVKVEWVVMAQGATRVLEASQLANVSNLVDVFND
jgi:hypothetical protein